MAVQEDQEEERREQEELKRNIKKRKKQWIPFAVEMNYKKTLSPKRQDSGSANTWSLLTVSPFPSAALSATLPMFGQKLSGVTHDIGSRGKVKNFSLRRPKKVKDKICTSDSGISPLGCDEKFSHFHY